MNIFNNDKAEMDTPKIIGTAIALLFMSVFIPSALASIFGADTSGWSTGAVSLWGALPIIIIAGTILYIGVMKVTGK